jgi:alpha-1,2-glucosyltransferase
VLTAVGDKSNHVATIHTPQMLYFWPFVIFFSFPLSMDVALCAFTEVLQYLNFASAKGRTVGGTKKETPFALPNPLWLASLIALSASAVRFNTIIHPFTLADNRHYVFYVFRILRSHPAIRYLSIPIYLLCGWLAMQTLGNPAHASNTSNSNIAGKKKPKATDEATRQPAHSGGSCGQLSFLIVWLGSTTLSVVTAPLVEPRYYIIPWLMWRLHIPLRKSGGHLINHGFGNDRIGYMRRMSLSWQLWLETFWYSVIHVVTAYVFLNRGFAWPSEPGHVQRFMW